MGQWVCVCGGVGVGGGQASVGGGLVVKRSLKPRCVEILTVCVSYSE